jgi:hypothetical protein
VLRLLRQVAKIIVKIFMTQNAQRNNLLKKIPSAMLIYPAMTLVLAAIILIIFIQSLLFSSGNINKVFSMNTVTLQSGMTRFDAANYDLIQRRFGLSVIASSSAVQANPSSTKLSAVPTSTPTKKK